MLTQCGQSRKNFNIKPAMITAVGTDFHILYFKRELFLKQEVVITEPVII